MMDTMPRVHTQAGESMGQWAEEMTLKHSILNWPLNRSWDGSLKVSDLLTVTS